MKYFTLIVGIFSMLIFSHNSYSQIGVQGFLQSSGYAWENTQDNSQFDYYQGLHLKVAPRNNQKIFLNTFLRAAYRGDPAEWEERIYNLYLNLNAGEKYQLRAGRQFVHKGVLNGTLDGALVGASLCKKIAANVFVGTEAMPDRSLDVLKWDDGNVLGGFLSFTQSSIQKYYISYVQKSRQKDQYWQQLGVGTNGYFMNNLNYYARFDYNLLTSSYQLLRGRLTYYSYKWSLSIEANSQKPRVFEDSFFNIFEVDAYNQIRTAGIYKLGRFDLGLQYLHTIYENDTDDKLIGSVGTRYGNIGIIYQNGYSGDNLGYFGEIQYDVVNNLTIRLFNSYYNFERAVTNISEDALSFSAGLRYKINSLFILNGEIQQSSNTYYENDWRGLFRLTYRFDI